jgi:hypothetical protein
MSFVFENRDTELFQIQEMVRAERIVDEKKIQDEIDVYKELIPGEGELSATMFIEIQDQSRIRATLESFLGLTRPGVVYLAIEDDIRVDAGIWKARRPFCQEPGKGRRVLYTRDSVSFYETRMANIYPGSLFMDCKRAQRSVKELARECLELTKDELEQHVVR